MPSPTKPTISRLFDSHAEAIRAAGDLVAMGVPRLKIAVIGPYSAELASLGMVPAASLGAAVGGLACLGAFVAGYGIDPQAPMPSPIALAAMVCGSIAGGLLGSLATDALRPGIATLVERIVLVTARVNDGGAEIVQGGSRQLHLHRRRVRETRPGISPRRARSRFQCLELDNRQKSNFEEPRTFRHLWKAVEYRPPAGSQSAEEAAPQCGASRSVAPGKLPAVSLKTLGFSLP